MTIKPRDIFGAAPKSVLNKPLMHVQDQKASGTHGGTNISGWNHRDLNTVLTNEISGASLSSNEVTLPAGEYQISAFAPCHQVSATKLVLRDASDENILMVGRGGWVSSTGNTPFEPRIEGRLTLSATTTIKLSHYASVVTSSVGLGTRADVGEIEVYSDLRIWQLDATVQTPVLINDKLYPLPGSTYVTGNMHGLEYARTGANQVTVQPGICMDSTNNVVLSLSSAQAVTIGTTINEIYNLFLCDDGVVRTDTDVDGANLSAYDFRWIGFVLTDSSGNILPFTMANDQIYFTSTVADRTIMADVDGNWYQVDISSWVPITRVHNILLGAEEDGGGNGVLKIGASNGGPELAKLLAQDGAEVTDFVEFYHNWWIFGDASNPPNALLVAARLKR